MPWKDLTKLTEAQGGYANKLPADFINRAPSASIRDWNGQKIGFDQYNQGWRPVKDDRSFIGEGYIEKDTNKRSLTLAEIAGMYGAIREQQEGGEPVGIEHLLLETNGYIKNLRSLRVKISQANDAILAHLNERAAHLVPDNVEDLKTAPWRLRGLKSAYPRKRATQSEEKKFNKTWASALKQLTGEDIG